MAPLQVPAQIEAVGVKALGRKFRVSTQAEVGRVSTAVFDGARVIHCASVPGELGPYEARASVVCAATESEAVAYRRDRLDVATEMTMRLS